MEKVVLDEFIEYYSNERLQEKTKETGCNTNVSNIIKV